jgi:large conductance mechanosensitive channel
MASGFTAVGEVDHASRVQAVHASRKRPRFSRGSRDGRGFWRVVTALVKDLITPLIAAIIGKPDFSAIEFTTRGSKFPIGDFINALVSFILIGAAVYFLIVLPVNKLLARMRRGEAAPDPTTKKCPECLSDVPIAARRCAFCTSVFADAGGR